VSTFLSVNLNVGVIAYLYGMQCFALHATLIVIRRHCSQLCLFKTSLKH